MTSSLVEIQAERQALLEVLWARLADKLVAEATAGRYLAVLERYRQELRFDPADPFGAGRQAVAGPSVRGSVSWGKVVSEGERRAEFDALLTQTGFRVGALGVAQPIPGPSAAPTASVSTAAVWTRANPLVTGQDWLRREGWQELCTREGVGPCDLLFERGGTLNAQRLRWRIVRRSDGQGLTGHIELTADPQADWELLRLRLQDCLEALAYMPEGAPYSKGV